MADQETIDFVQSKVASTTYVESGVITTAAQVFFANGTFVTGFDNSDVSVYVKETAQKSAYDNAIASLLPGVALILNKQP